MTKRKVSKIIAFLNLLVVFVLVTDNYLLPVKKYPALVKEKNQAYTKARIGYQGYSSNLIRDQNNIQYNVTEYCYRRLNIDDHFTVVRTALFKKAIIMKYNLGSNSYSLNSGVINETFFGIFVLALIGLVCFMLILFRKFSKVTMLNLKQLLQ